MREINFKISFKSYWPLFFESRALIIIGLILTILSISAWLIFYFNNLGLAYNDARSHLDIARRAVEGLKPGLAQLGSVWLPLPHALSIPFVWNNFLWHSGLAGSISSMVSFVATGILIYFFLKFFKVSIFSRLVAVFVFSTNLNVLYLQSTAMTELLLLATMMAGIYYFVLWHKTNNLFSLIQASFWVMLSSLVRYEGWFLFVTCIFFLVFHLLRKRGFAVTEGLVIFFSTLAAFGIILWFGWNLFIFKDPFYFAFGPFSAHAQQNMLESAGNLATKGNIFLSLKFYVFALAYNSGAFHLLLGFLGFLVFLWEKKIKTELKIASLVLLSPLVFNVLALYLGHSVLYIQGLSGNTWFNVRYGLVMIPPLAIFIGFLVEKLKRLRFLLVGLLLSVTFVSFFNQDAVTIDDARTGASQKNVAEVSQWLKANTATKDDYILISAASHDAIIFSSGLPMKRFIHEGTGKYWETATKHPATWAKWIIMRTYDVNDLTYKEVSPTTDFAKYRLVGNYPFADIYELKPEYWSGLTKKFPSDI